MDMQDKLMQHFQMMDRAYEEYAKSKGMTYLSLVVLEEIYEIGNGCTQKKISEETHYPKQTVNLVIKSFLENGYVELHEIPTNRKNKEIRLTQQGQQLCNDIVVPLLEKEDQAIAGMGADQSRELMRLLEMYSTLYCKNIEAII